MQSKKQRSTKSGEKLVKMNKNARFLSFFHHEDTKFIRQDNRMDRNLFCPKKAQEGEQNQTRIDSGFKTKFDGNCGFISYCVTEVLRGCFYFDGLKNFG